MNESGVGVRRVVLGEAAEEVVVVHDELELGLGRVRVRKGGSAR
jgi:peptidyl-tRNA hydrolase